MLLSKPFSTTDVAKRYGVVPHTITNWIRNGCPTPRGPVKLPAAKYGAGWKITEEDLLLFEHRLRPPVERPELDVEAPVEKATREGLTHDIS